MKTLSYTEALREGLVEEMSSDGDVILIGEDIAAYGGAFGVTRGLVDRFGTERVINTPISEGSFVGVGIGAALAGSRPVVEIMFMDFLALAADQLVNQAAKLHYVFGKGSKCPLVVRTPSGAGRCYGPTHSQTLTAWFVHTPGIKVVVPATPSDAKGLLKTAIRDDNPVLFVEHKLLYATREPVASIGRKAIPFGKARTVMHGSDITVVAWSYMSVQAEVAGRRLAQAGVSVDLIDPRTLSPLDMDTIVESVRRTGKVLIVQEAPKSGGVAGEIAMRIFEEAYDYLDAPIKRLATPDIPIPASPVLESAALPDADSIEAAVRELMATAE